VSADPAGRRKLGLSYLARQGLRIALIYLAVSAVWIATSDHLLASWFPEATPEQMARLQTIKGWGFVLVTAALLYLLIWRSLGRLARAQESARSAEAQLTYAATHDAVTGLPNRAYLRARLEQELAAARMGARQLSLILLDIQRFTTINESYGYEAGNALLADVGRALQRAVRAGDTVARLEGDEFAVVLADMRPGSDVAAVVKKGMAAISRAFRVDGHEVFPAFACGVALYPDHGADAETIMRAAGAALYEARKAGPGGAVTFYTTTLGSATRERVELERDLRRALDEQQFVLHYQPQFDVATRRVVGMEALLRWNRRAGDIVTPARFIPLAEETALIVPIGRWALNEACRQAQAWRAQGHEALTVSVNLSVRQFLEPDLVQDVVRALERSGLPPARLELEITESLLLTAAREAGTIISALRARGVHMVLDDFGTGYSSLGYLRRFRLDRLKIDQSFVREITHNNDDEAISKTIVALGHALGMQVVAEGVETIEQARKLASLGCDHLQGFLLGRPAPAAALEPALGRPAAHDWS
jgi:diguanylate cyclase (GGDEF)-like protein